MRNWAFGVIVNVWLPPLPTVTVPIGEIVPPAPALAMMLKLGPTTRVLEMEVAVVCGKRVSATYPTVLFASTR